MKPPLKPRRRMKHGSSILYSLLTSSCFAFASGPGFAAETWDVSETRANDLVTFDSTLSEGTWMSLDVAPDGETILFDLLGHIYEMPATGGKAKALTEGRTWNMFPRYSPDGRKLLITSDRGGSDDLWVLEIASGAWQNVSAMPEGVTGGTWSADGRAVYGVAMIEGTKNTGYRFGLDGTRQEIVPAPQPTAARPGAGLQGINHFRDDPERGLIWFEQIKGPVYKVGFAIQVYDKATGEIRTVITRPGGALAPALSPDGRYLAYVHRDDLESELVLHEIDTGIERVLLERIERDRQDYTVYHHAAYPTMSWFPDGNAIAIWYGGKIHRVDIRSGEDRVIPFEARVQRRLDPTIRFRTEVPAGTARTRLHRWAQRAGDEGILFEVLGDLYLHRDGHVENLTDSAAHESSPLYDPTSGRVYFAGWSDEELGAVYRRRLGGGRPEKLTDVPSQYGSLALSADGKQLAFVRGVETLRNGTKIEAQANFELVTMDAKGGDGTVVTDISMAGAEFGKRPPFAAFANDGKSLYFTEFDGTVLVLKRIGRDGRDEQVLYKFPNAAAAQLSPDERWILYEEYQRTWLTPFEFIGKPVMVSAADGVGTSRRLDAMNDGLYARFSADGRTVAWTRGTEFLEKSVEAAWKQGQIESRVDISVPYEVLRPGGAVAFTNARVLTMDAGRRIVNDATLVVDGDRIAAIGTDVDIPAGAHVIDLAGRTIIPGIVDVHAHYMGEISATHTIEQHVASLEAGLAHGVTTMYEVYGTIPKDTWLSDMLRAGKVIGPRLYTVGTPMYNVRTFRPKTFRSFADYDEVLEQVRFNKAHGATALKDYLTNTRRVRHQLATAAREEGLNLVVEPGGEGQSNLTRVIDGATDLAHAMGFTAVYQDYVEFFTTSEIAITPTLIVTLDGPMGENWFHQHERLWENDGLLHFEREEELIARLRRPQHVFEDDYYHPELAGNLRKLYDAGVPMQLGGHGQLLGLDAHMEMALLDQGGFAAMEILAIATINGARLHGLDHEIGSLEPGKRADLVVLEADPLDDIRNTRQIHRVMKNGMLYDGRATPVWPNPAPATEFYFK